MNLDAEGLLEALKGRSTTFAVDGRGANLVLAQVLLSSSTKKGVGCRVLDLDALFSSNAGKLLKGIPDAGQESVLLDVPDPGAPVAQCVAALLREKKGLVVIDSLNTLHHLLGLDGRSLSFVVGSFSIFAKSNRVACVFSMYERRGPFGSAGGGSIAQLSDAEVRASVREGELRLECRRGDLWPGAALTLRIT